jgi:hypothetical protein
MKIDYFPPSNVILNQLCIKSIIEYGPLSLNQVFHFLIEIENGFQILKNISGQFPVKVNISSVTQYLIPQNVENKHSGVQVPCQLLRRPYRKSVCIIFVLPQRRKDTKSFLNYFFMSFFLI